MKNLLLLLLFAGSLMATDLEEALDAAKKGDYETAVNLWRPLAERGEAPAQYNLAVSYCLGNGVEKDLKQCAYWARKAYRNGRDTSRLFNDFNLTDQ